MVKNIVIGILIFFVSYLGMNYHLSTYNGKTAKEWSDQYQQQKTAYVNLISSDDAIMSSQSADLKTAIKYLQPLYPDDSYEFIFKYGGVPPVPPPSPSPKVIYQTQYVQSAPQQDITSNTTNCRSDYIGGYYCTSDTGVQTHCRSNYAGGMVCQ